MALTRVPSARIVKSGFWIFSQWDVYIGKRPQFRLNKREFNSLAGRNAPVPIGEDGGRMLWLVGEDFYWDSDGLDAEAIELLLWDRSRRLDAKLVRLQKIRTRADEVAMSRRERIPDDVRAFVWDRDEGQCVRCGADDNLQFDHVIPVAKGGSNAPENIQLLCLDCNQLKSDHIA
jgi:hypothetical protein